MCNVLSLCILYKIYVVPRHEISECRMMHLEMAAHAQAHIFIHSENIKNREKF